MKTIYFNEKSVYGVETIDEFNSSDFATYKDFLQEVKRCLYEYRLENRNVYKSQRCTKEWRNK